MKEGIALFLKGVRERTGLSVEAAIRELTARGISIASSKLSEYENGLELPDVEEFFEICCVYHVESFSELMDEMQKNARARVRQLSFGDRIRIARTTKGLLQSNLAKKLKVTNTSVSNWENNITQPDVDKIIKLCDILDVTPNYLFGFSDDDSCEEKQE